MKKRGVILNLLLAVVIALVALIGAVISPASPPQAVQAQAIIYVPDDYLTIQGAVDAATPGDTIVVRAGTYTENVDVNKSLTIQSENGADQTIVQAADSYDHVFEVSANYVNITGFMVKGTGQGGIYLNAVNQCDISSNRVTNNYWGICLYSSSHNALTNNTCSSNVVGIHLSGSSNNTISNNAANSNSGFAIYPYDSSNNTIYANNFNNTSEHSTNVHSYSSTNTWNSAEPRTYTYKGSDHTNYLGNYWDNYSGSDADGDGIGDSPYSIARDYYPLMEPFENYQQILERTVRIYTRPYVPIGEVKVTYNQVGEDTYKVSEIDFRAIGFSGVCQVLVFDDTEVKWSDQMFVLPGGPYTKTYVAPFGGEFPKGITVHGSDAVGLRLAGIDLITFCVTAVKKPTDWLLTKLPYLGPILDAFHVDLETILSAVGADPWKYPVSFAKSASCQFDPESTETPSLPGEELLQVLGAMMFSPGELRVYDTQGRVTGLVNGEARNEIPNSKYQGETVIILSPTDTYRFEIAGTDDDSYGLVISSIQEESSTFKATDIPVRSGAIHEYTIDWDALSQAEEGVTVTVDFDGDGMIDCTFSSDATLTQEEFIEHTRPVGGTIVPTDKARLVMPWIMAAALIVVAGVSLAVWNRKRGERASGR